MKVAIIGSGGREHALALKIAESKILSKLYAIPGNPGIKNLAENYEINISNHSVLIQFCSEKEIDLVVIGPEKPLTEGLTDSLRNAGFVVFGPSKSAARIEGEKSFAKKLMFENNIPTASFHIYLKEDYEEAIKYLRKTKYPIVIKANGIASGKGVIIADTFDDAKEAVKECFINSSFGSAGDKIVIEECMTGQEASIFAVTDGTDFVLLPAAQDHKRIHDGDLGKNTGGMGAYAPTPFVDKNELQFVSEKIIKPTLQAMKKNGFEFVGCLYCGIMLTPEGPKVVEFNCRFGDPETQVVLPLLKGDFLKLLYSAAIGKLDLDSVQISEGTAVCVVLASKNYPDSSEKGIVINGLENFPSGTSHIIHSGTKEVNGKIVTDGGRVLGVVASIEQNDLRKCKEIAYEAISKIYFDGMQFRKDISDKGILAKS
ncbi:MAG: phosphoribosylamine/glycine ligase [Ignavibacteria bacterium]|nr:MAG: phosphoribosylamine/glycine ligase [Ignavibacteria bacterium]KAF0159927.1 MAG: phosphoribosylamine/glycine ligase [Ignavibacteria bacterium]